MVSKAVSCGAVGGPEMASLLTVDVMNLLVRALSYRRHVIWYLLCTFLESYTGQAFVCMCAMIRCSSAELIVWALNLRGMPCLQTNGAVRSIVRKKAATCLLRLIRKSPAEAEILQPDVWSVKLVRCCASLSPYVSGRHHT